MRLDHLLSKEKEKFLKNLLFIFQCTFTILSEVKNFTFLRIILYIKNNRVKLIQKKTFDLTLINGLLAQMVRAHA